MKKFLTIFLAILCSHLATAQFFSENFESYTVNSYLGPQSPNWTPWSGTDGGSDDVLVSNTNASSGTKSIYFNSPGGGGPNDMVLTFGSVHSTGRFKFTSKFFVPTGKAAYFNFQGGSFPGSLWTIEFYMYSGATFNIPGFLTGSYPQNKWFELVIDADLTNDKWELIIDGVSKGTFTNTNPISYLNIYPADVGSEYWVDDISYCVNSACNPELEMQSVVISPSSLCTHQKGDATIKLKNNSTFPAPKMTLGLDIGPNRITQQINLNNLAGGKDTTFTVSNVFVSKIAGTAVPVKAINIQGDLIAANDTAYTTANVKPSPSMTGFVKGTPYVSPRPLTNGTSNDPDIVAAKDALTYEITPPVGFTNSDYTSKWRVNGITLRTSSGIVLSTSYFNFSVPAGSVNAKILFTPDSLITDSVLTLSFSVVDVNNSCDSSLSRYIYVAPKPKAGFNASNVCDKDKIDFGNVSSVLKGSLSYNWDFGDLTTSNLAEPTKTYAAPGAYNVKLIVTTNYGYTDTLIKVINVYPIPVADFKAVHACEGVPVGLSDNSTLPTGTPTYEWDFGTQPPTSGTGATTSKLYSVPGIYLVNFKVTVNGCSSSTSKYVTQAPKSFPDFSFPAAECDNGGIQFTNNTPAIQFGTTSYTWKFGDGNLSTQNAPNHTYNSFSTFNVVLISRSDLGCADSITKSVTLRQSPKASYTKSAATCSNDPINFTNTSIVPPGFTNAYSWNFGDGDTTNVANPTHNYVAPGTYTINLKSYSTNGCSSEWEAPVTILLKPVSDFEGTDVCKGAPTVFSNNSYVSDNSAMVYKWKFGNGDSSAVAAPSFIYTTAGVYTVTLETRHGNGCASVATKQVKVSDVPVVSLLWNSNHTTDGKINFATNTTGTGYTYKWQFGDGGSSTLKNPSYQYLFDGLYTVKLTVTSPEGCTSSDETTVWIARLGINDVQGTTVNVYPNPSKGNFTIEVSQAFEAGSQITINNMLGAKVYQATPTVGDTKATVNIDGIAAGIYTVNITHANRIETMKVVVE